MNINHENHTDETEKNSSESLTENGIENNELDVCKTELVELKERFVRVSADLDNYRRRIEKEKIQWMQIAQANVLRDMIPVLDDFDRALADQEKLVDQSLARWVEGLKLMRESFYKILHNYGVEEIAQAVSFDPELHEALMHVDSPSHESGQIVAILQKGYRFKDQVLRPAKVSVAR